VSTPQREYRYNAFMSYSHEADKADKLAPALQTALHRFAKPWFRLRPRPHEPCSEPRVVVGDRGRA
jgi:hypothetical protein